MFSIRGLQIERRIGGVGKGMAEVGGDFIKSFSVRHSSSME